MPSRGFSGYGAATNATIRSAGAPPEKGLVVEGVLEKKMGPETTRLHLSHQTRSTKLGGTLKHVAPKGAKVGVTGALQWAFTEAAIPVGEEIGEKGVLPWVLGGSGSVRGFWKWKGWGMDGSVAVSGKTEVPKPGKAWKKPSPQGIASAEWGQKGDAARVKVNVSKEKRAMALLRTVGSWNVQAMAKDSSSSVGVEGAAWWLSKGKWGDGEGKKSAEKGVLGGGEDGVLWKGVEEEKRKAWKMKEKQGGEGRKRGKKRGWGEEWLTQDWDGDVGGMDWGVGKKGKKGVGEEEEEEKKSVVVVGSSWVCEGGVRMAVEKGKGKKKGVYQSEIGVVGAVTPLKGVGCAIKGDIKALLPPKSPSPPLSYSLQLASQLTLAPKVLAAARTEIFTGASEIALRSLLELPSMKVSTQLGIKSNWKAFHLSSPHLKLILHQNL